MMLAFVEALYLAGRTEVAAAFSPLIEEALGLGFDWIAFDCRLLHTRAGMAAAADGQWDAAETHYRSALEFSGGLPRHAALAEAMLVET